MELNNYFNILFWEYEFLSPFYLWSLLIVPFYFWFSFIKNKIENGELKYSNTLKNQLSLESVFVKRIIFFIKFINAIVLILIILALAKPHYLSGFDEEKNYRYKNGIDIVIAMDISLSMMARDFEPNRLEAAKKVAKEFIDSREGDRIGLVVYEGEAFTACPSTLDYSILKQQIDHLQPGLVEGGTAIGTGLGTAVTRLRNDSLPSKVIILLTDGVNNQGEISPEMAAQLAKSKNIKVYTIGIGTIGMAPSPVFTPFGVQYENIPVEIDEETLIKVSEITSGKYFRATDEESLRTIYNEISKLEKIKLKTLNTENEIPIHTLPYLIWALILFVFSVFLKHFYLKIS
jgi:Ca-activated chloride channel family protein